jgi:flagellar protein FliS
MYSNQFKSYQTSNIGTADRGKLVIMIYDHVLKWGRSASEAIQANNIENRTKAIFKMQDGITELMCSLDFEKGGEVAKNLNNLYEFYNKHLSEANIKNSEKNVKEVIEMMQLLKSAWEEAMENIRKSNSINMNNGFNNGVSLVG